MADWGGLDRVGMGWVGVGWVGRRGLTTDVAAELGKLFGLAKRHSYGVDGFVRMTNLIVSAPQDVKGRL
jgi:hypothetical protein